MARLARIFRRGWRDYIARHLWPRPEAVNLPITAGCNCRCVMCGIGCEQSTEEDLTLDQIRALLADKHFRGIEGIGLSGGEPFLRQDLEDIVSICCEHPRLSSLTISTNGLLTNRIQAKVPNIAAICRDHGVSLRFSVSVDGIGPVHDQIRGFPGAWPRVCSTLDYLRQRDDVDLVSGSTLSPGNLEAAFEIRDFCRRRCITPDFRTAVVIDRLRNQPYVGPGWCHEEPARHRLYEWFSNLSRDKSLRVERRIYYADVARFVAGQGPRRTICRARTGQMAYIDESGGVYWCAVAGGKLGQVPESLTELYLGPAGQARREAIEADDCPTCIHDYRTVLPLATLARYIVGRSRLPHLVEMLGGALRTAAASLRSRGRSRGAGAGAKRCLVVGWWGTETAGDKAILDGLLRDIGALRPDWGFDILSIDTPYTEGTLVQLGRHGDVGVLPLRQSWSAVPYARYDALFFGGGPLMDIASMQMQTAIVCEARAAGVPTILYGCGLGPLRRGISRWSVRKLLRTAGFVGWRDSRSQTKAAALCGEPVGSTYADPALSAVAAWTAADAIEPATAGAAPRRLGLAVRRWSRHYQGQLDPQRVAEINERLAAALRQTMDAFAADSWDVVLIPMNTFWRGDDDREYLADLRARCEHADKVRLIARCSDARETVREIRRCRALVAMRYHAVAFALAAGVPVVPVDYTVGGGKIGALLADAGIADGVLGIEDVTPEALIAKVRAAVEQDGAVPAAVGEQVDAARRLAADAVAWLESDRA